MLTVAGVGLTVPCHGFCWLQDLKLQPTEARHWSVQSSPNGFCRKLRALFRAGLTSGTGGLAVLSPGGLLLLSCWSPGVSWRSPGSLLVS